MRRVYLDNASTSWPKAPGCAEAMYRFLQENGANASRGVYGSALSTDDLLYRTRQEIAELFAFDKSRNVVFTPSVTYALNMVIRGVLRKGDHAIISGMEHNAVARPMEDMKKHGVSVSVAPCGREGLLDFETFESLFRDNTRMVVICHASNVCGTIQDAERIGKICRKHKAFFVLDAAQSAGSVPIDFYGFGLSALCLPGHKGLMGPQGVGALLVSDHLAEEISPVILGGTGSASHLLTMPDFLPDRLEPGTLNLPGIAGLQASVSYVRKTGIGTIREHEKSLTRIFLDGLSEIQGVFTVGLDTAEGRTGVVSVTFSEMDGADVAAILDSDYGIAVRPALHCAPLAHRTLGTYPAGTVRFSFGSFTKEEEVRFALKALREIVA